LILASLMLLVVSVPAVAADDPCTARAERFLTQLGAGNGVEALDELYASNPWIQSSQDDILSLKNQLAGLEGIVGAYHSHLPMSEVRLAGCWVYLGYLVLFDRQPIRFEFQFYRPDSEWMTYSFSYDDDLDEDVVAEGRDRALQAGP
jgi:hypothetical protein